MPVFHLSLIPSAEGNKWTFVDSIGTDKNLPCLDCGEDVGKWFQKVLGKDGLRLVCHVEDLTKATREITKDQSAYSTFEKSDIVSLL